MNIQMPTLKLQTGSFSLVDLMGHFVKLQYFTKIEHASNYCRSISGHKCQSALPLIVGGLQIKLNHIE